MMRSTCVLLFGLSIAVGAEAQVDRSCPEAAVNTVTGNHQTSPTLCSRHSKPIVMWDVSGFTFLGFVHGNLVVYNDGVASVSSLITGDVRTAFVGPAVAELLRGEVILAGGMTLCDPAYETIDATLTTLTVFAGSNDAGDTDVRAHTFSYWEAAGGYAKVYAVIQDFLVTHFPGFSLI